MNTDTIYTETTGTTCYVNGQRGIITGLHYWMPGRLAGAFVKLDEEPVMLFVELGSAVGERGAWHEVVGFRVIDRDEFDRITDLHQLRTDLGWVA